MANTVTILAVMLCSSSDINHTSHYLTGLLYSGINISKIRIMLLDIIMILLHLPGDALIDFPSLLKSNRAKSLILTGKLL